MPTCSRAKQLAVDQDPLGKFYDWRGESTYVRNPPYFEGMTMTPRAVTDVTGARCLAVLGDSVTTDHISPAGDIAKTSPAAKYLVSKGVQPIDFNSYGARRGNHEVMMRGTFANIRLRNRLAPGTEGGVTKHVPTGDQMSIFDAAMRYKQEGTPLVIFAGKEYGTGSSRDWAAKGTVARRARRHRRELRAHPPLQSDRHGRVAADVRRRQGRDLARAHGQRSLRDHGLNNAEAKTVKVVATPPKGSPITFEARVRIDTPKERDYYRHGGILQYVLRQLASKAA